MALRIGRSAPRPPHPAEYIAAAPDPFVELHYQRRHHGPRLYIGMLPGDDHNPGGILCADPRTHLLVLGPPQGRLGKNSGVLVPNVLAAPGPCVVVSTKSDLLRDTAAGRFRIGPVGAWIPDAPNPVPGLGEARVSPITGCGGCGTFPRSRRSCG